MTEFPTLEDAWRWYLKGAEPAPTHQPISIYAADVRQGRWPDRVATEFSVQAVYLALAQDTLLRLRDQSAWERDVSLLFDATKAHLSAGGSLLDDTFLREVPGLQRYVAQLTDDQRLFDEDLKRGRKLSVTLPAEASFSGERTVTLLVLDRPTSTQFKLWARRVEKAALLIVAQPDGGIVVSADPSQKLTLAWLAKTLSARDAKPWYAGERHEGTLIAAPREGSKLRVSDIVAVLGGRAPTTRRWPFVLVASAAAVVAVATHAIEAPGDGEPPSNRERPRADGAKGAPLPPAQVLNLLASSSGPRAIEGYALVAGVCGYSGDRLLRSPCRDARAVRELLVSRLGYRPENVMYFIDQPEPGEVTDGVPTARALKLAVERFRARFTADESSSFLVYYSGHGGFETGARRDFGVLQPAGYFDHPDEPISERGWDMQELIDDVRKGVPSKHVMVILDACYSGWAAGAKGPSTFDPAVRSLWRERAEVVLAAAARGQRAWEDEGPDGSWGGHSALTAFLLEGLGRSLADRNADKVITDEELALFLSTRVPESVRALRQAEQAPQFFRFDEQLPKSGQFLFIPQEP